MSTPIAASTALFIVNAGGRIAELLPVASNIVLFSYWLGIQIFHFYSVPSASFNFLLRLRWYRLAHKFFTPTSVLISTSEKHVVRLIMGWPERGA
jgi:hypothetical protein